MKQQMKQWLLNDYLTYLIYTKNPPGSGFFYENFEVYNELTQLKVDGVLYYINIPLSFGLNLGID